MVCTQSVGCASTKYFRLWANAGGEVIRENFSAEPHDFQFFVGWGLERPERHFGRSGTDDLFPIVTSSRSDAIITVLAYENSPRQYNVIILQVAG